MYRDATKKQYLQVIVGDTILVTNAMFTGGAYKNGDTGIVRMVADSTVQVEWPNGQISILWNEEYEIVGA